MAALFVLWLLQLVANVQQLLDPEKFHVEKVSTLVFIKYLSIFSTGIVLGTVRSLADPYHFYIIRSAVAEWFGIILELPKNKDRIISKPLYAYLAESLNLELINVIL